MGETLLWNPGLPGCTVHRESALERVAEAAGHMSSCDLCAWDCRVDRTGGPAGVCRAGSRSNVFRHGIDWAGEAELVPTLVFNPSGCNFNCDFCITGYQSQNASAGEPLDLHAVSLLIRESLPFMQSVTLEGGEPSIHLPSMLELASLVPETVLLVWKTNAYASAAALDLIVGIPDVMLADLKFGNDACARRLAGVNHYMETVKMNLEWAATHTRLIVRHLLMPGHLECCLLPALDWMAENIPQIPVSMMNGFLPKFRSWRHEELQRTLRASELERAHAEAQARGIILAPWRMVTGRQTTPEATDEIWVDRNGRICVNFASAALVQCLKRLTPELEMER